MTAYINKILRFITILLLLFAAAFGFDESMTTITLYAAIPAAFGLSILQHGNPLAGNRYIKWLLVLYLWICCTYIGAEYVEEANRQMSQILGVVLMGATLSNMSKDEQNLKWMYLLFILIFISLLKYVSENLISDLEIFQERVGDDKLNTNILGYFTFCITVAIYALSEVVKNKTAKRSFEILFLLTIVLSYLMALFTASRQVLVIQIPLYASLLFVRYGMGVSKYKFYFILTIILLLVISSGYVETLYQGSLLQTRNELEIDEDERMAVIKEAIEIGTQHPIMGVGPGNFIRYSKFQIFSHCSYTELYANAGIIGVGIYIFILASFIRTQWKRYKKTNDKRYLSFFIIGAMFAVYNLFYVFYTVMWLMGFLVLIISHSETYHHKQSVLNTQHK